jgi:hypothetical protein
MRHSGLSAWVAIAALLFLLPLPSRAATPEDLSSWAPESYPGTADPTTQPGNWVLGTDNVTVTQTANGAPTFYATTHPADDHRITVSFAIPETTDNDFVGFALGFDPGDTANSGADFLLVDWRQTTQAIQWFDSPMVGGTAGLAVTRITGVPLWGEIWSHDDLTGGAEVSELGRGATLGDAGWAEEVTYDFEIEYQTDRLRIWVDGVLEFDLTGDFPPGGFALYNFSQIGVEAGPVTFEEINEAPEVASAADDVTVAEGDNASTTGSFTDPDGDTLTLTCAGACDGFTDNLDGTWTWSRVEPEGPASHDITVTADDGVETVSDSFTVTVTNLPPVITSTSGVPSMHALDTSLAVHAAFTDPGVLDTHTAVFSWGDGTTSPGTVTEAAGTGAAEAAHAYAAPGTYTVTVTITDDDGASDTATLGTVFVFDPDTFVTGGGWISTPEGALTSGLTPKGTFGFVVRYRRDGTVAGNLEFHAGKDLRLHATSLADLRIVSGIARFEGTGRVGREEGYSFRVVATDERLAGSGQDLFLIEVQAPDGSVVFDGSALPSAGAPIKGKGIQIHR